MLGPMLSSCSDAKNPVLGRCHFPNQFLYKIDDCWFEMSPIGKFGILDFGYPEIRHWKNVVMFTKRFVINVAFMLELIRMSLDACPHSSLRISQSQH